MRDVRQAESGVRRLHARYADAVWRRDRDAFLDCFAADGEWKIAGRHMRGRAEVADAYDRLMAPSARILMMFGTTIIHVDNDGGLAGRTQVSELIKLRDGGAIRTMGVYYERFSEAADGWRFAWRHFDLFCYGPPDLSGLFVEGPDYGPPPAMPPPDAPTFVRPASP